MTLDYFYGQAGELLDVYKRQLYQRADPKAYLRAHLDEMQEAAP